MHENKKAIKIEKGTKQGDTMSPIERETVINGLGLNSLTYADDVVLIKDNTNAGRLGPRIDRNRH